MSIVIEGRQFRQDLWSPATYSLPDPLEDVHLRRCTFESFQHPSQRAVGQRPTLRRLILERCHFTACDLGPVVLEDVIVDTTWIHRGKWGPQRLAGCAFRRVTIRGRVTGGIAFAPSNEWFLAWPKTDVAADPFVQANSEYYRNVDWALDISQAEFTGIEMSGCDIPARLIRRDPVTQAIVTRDSLASADWRGACAESAMWVGIERFMETGLPDSVLVAAKRSRFFEGDLAALQRLREVGAALPD